MSNEKYPRYDIYTLGLLLVERHNNQYTLLHGVTTYRTAVWIYIMWI